MDVDPGPFGEEQSRALARWFVGMPEADRPEVVLASPYVWARRTAESVRDAGGCDGKHEFIIDERLRGKEFGILDRLKGPCSMGAWPREGPP